MEIKFLVTAHCKTQDWLCYSNKFRWKNTCRILEACMLTGFLSPVLLHLRRLPIWLLEHLPFQKATKEDWAWTPSSKTRFKVLDDMIKHIYDKTYYLVKQLPFCTTIPHSSASFYDFFMYFSQFAHCMENLQADFGKVCLAGENLDIKSPFFEVAFSPASSFDI